MYERLGISKTATNDEIKSKYHELVKAYHPDRLKEEEKEEGQKIISAVNEAYDILKDEKKRQEYDASQFTGSIPFVRQRPTRVYRHGINLSFIESVFGVSRTLDLMVDQQCHKCHGNCTADGKPPLTCQMCGGVGFIQNGFFPMPCPHCGGRGFTVENPCPECHGEGLTSKQTQITVSIPPGVDHGSVVNFDTAYGRVSVVCMVQSDPLFKRDGDDLHVTVPISVKTAMLGGRVRIPTLRGVLEKKVLPGTQPYDVERLDGYGVSRRGALFIHYKVFVPRSLSRREKESLAGLTEKHMIPTNDMWNSNLTSFEQRLKAAKN